MCVCESKQRRLGELDKRAVNGQPIVFCRDNACCVLSDKEKNVVETQNFKVTERNHHSENLAGKEY